MDYYLRIQNAIDFIEENLKEGIGISEISSKANFSEFHFQRIFQAVLGYSVQGYIRSRRLSEAAELLKATSNSILNIALEYQYNSQEAFTRAFKKQFGLTPASFRKSNEESLNKLDRINLCDYQRKIEGAIEVDKPNIVVIDKIEIVGYEYRTSLENEKYFVDIPNCYSDFGNNEYYLSISNRATPAFAYGVNCNYQENGEFSFVVGEAVNQSASELEIGFVSLEIPKGKYAEFRVKGSTEVSQNTWRYIYGTWLLNSNYNRREGPDFEVVDVCNSQYPEKMMLSIYIPIE